MIAPGCYDLVDYVGWQSPPPALADHDSHAHNRLLSSAVLNAGERQQVAHAINDKLSKATGPVTLFLPQAGCNEWDRPGAPLHDAEGLAAFCEALSAGCPGNVELRKLDGHINDAMFTDAVLELFDQWIKHGIVQRS